jgi:hypothetical protein
MVPICKFFSFCFWILVLGCVWFVFLICGWFRFWVGFVAVAKLFFGLVFSIGSVYFGVGFGVIPGGVGFWCFLGGVELLELFSMGILFWADG